MRWSVIPFERLKAIDLGCSGFARAVAKCVQQGDEPDVHVLRVAPQNGKSHWYIEVQAGCSRTRFEIDMSRLETQAAVVPIYFVDHVRRIREELSEVFEIDGFMDGVNRVVPFRQIHGGAKPS